MKAILLSRVSDASQKEGYSLDGQLSKLMEYIHRHELEYCESLVFRFDETAHKEKRQKFEEVLKVVRKSREPLALVADKVDRLTRNFSKQLIEIETHRRAGRIELHFVSDHMILTKDSSAGEQFMFTMFVAQAKLYSDSIRDHIRRSYAEMLKQGRWYSKAPFGYKHVHLHSPDGTKIIKKDIVLHETNGALMRRAILMRMTGEVTYEALANYLNEHQAKTQHKNRFTARRVQELFMNPWYMGYMRAPDGTWHKHIYPTLATEEEWYTCQMFNKRRYKVTRPFLLSGLVRCGLCGYLCSPYTSKEKVYLQCTKCHKSRSNERLILERLMSHVHSFALSEGQINAIADRYKSELAMLTPNTQGELSALQNDRKRIDIRINSLLDLRLDGEISSEEYTKKLDELKKALYDIDNKVTKLEGLMSIHITKTELRNAIRHITENMRSTFDGSRPEVKARFLKMVISNLTLSGTDVTLELKPVYAGIFSNAQNNKMVDRNAAISNVRELIAASKQIRTEEPVVERAFSVALGGQDGRMDQTP